MIPQSVLIQAVNRIHQLPELAGCLVGYYGDQLCQTIGYPSCVTANSENVAVIIEENATSDTATRVAKVPMGQVVPIGPQARAAVTNRSRLASELAGVGFNCGFAVVSAIGVAGGIAAEVPTGGVSSLLVAAGWVGLGAGALQCSNGVFRVSMVLADLDGSSLDELDSNQRYSLFMLVVDAVGVSTNVASLPYSARNLWAVMSRLSSFKAANLSFEVLRSMNRVQRLRAVARVFQDATRTEKGLAAVMSGAREAQIGARSFSRPSGISVRHSDTLVKIIHDETVRRLVSSLLSVFSNIASPVVSATPSGVTGSASGSVNYVVHLLDTGRPNL